MAIEGTLNDIKKLLDIELPWLAASFNPPATSAEIKQAEKDTGLAFPDDLRKLYLTHNGQKNYREGFGDFFFGCSFLTLDEMVNASLGWMEIRNANYDGMDTPILSTPFGWIKEQYANGRCLPFCQDGGGNHLAVDLDPAEQGFSGQVFNCGRDEDFRYVFADSITKLFELILDQLIAGNYNCAPSPYREGRMIFSMGKKEDSHFFDVLRQLDLPYKGNSQTAIKNQEENIDFAEWFNSLDENWQKALKHLDTSKGFTGVNQQLQLYFLGMKEFCDLSPVNHFRGLRRLVISGTKVVDLSPLADLKLLKTVYAGKTPVTDLSPLSNSNELVSLSFNDSAVEDIGGLAGLKKLRELNLADTAVRDISVFSKTPGIESLSLRGTRVENFAPLGDLMHLKQLNLSSTSIDDFSFVQNCPNLTKLECNNIEATDFSMLKVADKLREITCNSEVAKKVKKVVDHEILYKVTKS